MLANILMLQAAVAAFVGTIVLALSSASGIPLLVGVLLVCDALFCGLFLLVSWRLGVRSRHRRAVMMETARDHGFFSARA